MNHRTPQILLAVTAVLGLVIIFFYPPWQKDPDSSANSLVLPQPEQITSARFSYPRSGTWGDLEIAKQPSGQWSMSSAVISDSSIHQPLLGKFLSMMTSEWPLIPSSPDADTERGRQILNDMGLTPPFVRITLQQLNATSPVILELGREMDDREHVYARIEGQNAIGLAPYELLVMATQPPPYWKDRRFIEIAPPSITSITVESPGKEPVRLARDEVTTLWQIASPMMESAAHLSIEQKLQAMGQSQAIEYRQPGDTFEMEKVFGMTLSTLNGSDRRLEWFLIIRPEEDVSDEGEDQPPLFLVEDSESELRAIVTEDTFKPWTGGVDTFRDRQMLLFSPDILTTLKVEIFNGPSFSISRREPGSQWMVTSPSLPEPVMADPKVIEDTLKLASRMKIKSFPDIDWQDAAQVGLAPPRAVYSFMAKTGDTGEEVLVAQLRLGTLDQENQIVHAAHNRADRVYTLEPADALSLPRDIHRLRAPELFPEISSGSRISGLRWQSPVGNISYTRDRETGSWAGIGTVEAEALDNFCSSLADYRVDSWRGFGPGSLEALEISGDAGSGLRLQITTTDGSTHQIRFGKRSPRRGIYASRSFPEGDYVFNFDAELVDKLSTVDEISLMYR